MTAETKLTAAIVAALLWRRPQGRAYAGASFSFVNI
jgi:hypothetical protein